MKYKLPSIGAKYKYKTEISFKSLKFLTTDLGIRLKTKFGISKRGAMLIHLKSLKPNKTKDMFYL